MARKSDDAKARRVEEIIALARDRLAGDDATRLESFLGQYFAHAPTEDLLTASVLDLYGAALAHWNLAWSRTDEGPAIRVYTPQFDEHGWQSTHTVVEVVESDMPFLVDSIRMELNRHGLAVHLLIHPVIRVRRDESGQLAEVLEGDSPDGDWEAFVHAEVDRQSDPSILEGLTHDLRRILRDVRAAVEDWPAMTDRLGRLVASLPDRTPHVPAEELAEATAFLEWIGDDHFTFLGYREYDLVTIDGQDALRTRPGSGLGILRQSSPEPVAESFAKMPPEVRQLARTPELLNLTKANSVATVHRASHLDYIGLKRFDPDGQVSGECRFLGLYTSSVYNTSPVDVPVLRRKVATVLDRAGFPESSHSGKDLQAILETYPRDELFQISDDELLENAMGILQLQDRQRVALFVQRDRFGRFFSCLVFVPRERYSTETRQLMQAILREALRGVSVEYTARVSESVLARLHLVIRTEPGDRVEWDVAEIEQRLAAAVRSWADDLHDALVEQCGEDRGIQLHRRYREAFPPGYRDDFVAPLAVTDIERLERLAPDDDLDMHLYRPLESRLLRFKLYRSGSPILVSDVLPLLENMGVRVIDERPYQIDPDGSGPRWIYDFGLACDDVDELSTGPFKAIFQETFAQVWRGDVENDGFNRLVLRAGLPSSAVVIMRAYCKYLRQTSTTFSQSYIEDCLAAHPDIVRRLVDLFDARLDPARTDHDATGRLIASEILAALDDVASLDEDRILRSYLALIEATLRTNAFQRDDEATRKPYLSIKLDPSGVPDLPLPRPRFEIFVYSPRVEGVHLRGGRVARGGLRWSDRREDFRSEVLGLMKAQMVKNAVIVPVGAKGGFVVKHLPVDGDRDALTAEVVSCYRTLVAGLLDVTDNLRGAHVVPPPDTVRHDDDDPYLVVAADKGTASFSDIANTMATDFGYWLGDAFASGGSTGYDHKEMGITARGAWESVKRHFRELGIDVAATDFTVVGIGDMSGDVFGNGMLLSPHIKLVGAFNHQHVFLDPNPEPEASLRERARLFALPRSSWTDYDPALISGGGGVYPRTAKSIALSPEVKAVLNVTADALPPNEVIRALLRAPVDLLWNGGIGTYVKATAETHAEVGDKTNDPVRVDAVQLRCRVVAEGGNLGLTQRARIEFAQKGGLVNTDAIDNSAGVDCSDHEVNIKILLDGVVADGDMTGKQRNELIAEMTNEVAELVLRNNYLQTQAIANAKAQASSLVDVHARYVARLEQQGRLNRQLEFLPDDEEFADRKAAGTGLVAPEFAVLLAYTKIALYDDLLAADVPEDPHLSLYLEAYFPSPLRERLADRMSTHRLRREIIATRVANDLVDSMGISFLFRLSEETGASSAEITRAYAVAREVFDMAVVFSAVEALDNRLDASTQTAMLLEARKLTERAARWFLRHAPRPLDIAWAVDRYAAGTAILAALIPELLSTTERNAFTATAERLTGQGAPDDLAARVAGFEPLYAAPDIVDIARVTGAEVEAVAEVYFALGERLQLPWLRDQIVRLPRDDRWQTLARVALRDDAYAEHRALTAEVIEGSPPAADAKERIDRWLEPRAWAVNRCLQVLADIKSAGARDLPTLLVALREIHFLTQASEAGQPSRSDQGSPTLT